MVTPSCGPGTTVPGERVRRCAIANTASRGRRSGIQPATAPPLSASPPTVGGRPRIERTAAAGSIILLAAPAPPGGDTTGDSPPRPGGESADSGSRAARLQVLRGRTTPLVEAKGCAGEGRSTRWVRRARRVGRATGPPTAQRSIAATAGCRCLTRRLSSIPTMKGSHQLVLRPTRTAGKSNAVAATMSGDAPHYSFMPPSLPPAAPHLMTPQPVLRTG